MKPEQQPGPGRSDEEVLYYLEDNLGFTHVQVLKTWLSVDYEKYRSSYHRAGKLAICVLGLGAAVWSLQDLVAKAPAEGVINSRQIELESSAVNAGFKPAQTYMDSDGRRLNFSQEYGVCYLSISTVERPVMAEPGMSMPENSYIVVNPIRDGSRSLITDFSTITTLPDFTQCRIENSK